MQPCSRVFGKDPRSTGLRFRRRRCSQRTSHLAGAIRWRWNEAGSLLRNKKLCRFVSTERGAGSHPPCPSAELGQPTYALQGHCSSPKHGTHPPAKPVLPGLGICPLIPAHRRASGDNGAQLFTQISSRTAPSALVGAPRRERSRLTSAVGLLPELG